MKKNGMRLHIKTELSSNATLKTLGSMSVRTITLSSFPNPLENNRKNKTGCLTLTTFFNKNNAGALYFSNISFVVLQ